MGSNLNSSFLQPHLPAGSFLNIDTLLPTCTCTGDSPAQRELPLTSVWTFLHVLHIFTHRSLSQ